MDPYVVLGVDRVAGPDEIEAAYARRSRLHDPDAQSTDAERAAAERYNAELGDAYRALLGTTAPELPPTLLPGGNALGGNAPGGSANGARPSMRPATAVRPSTGTTPSPGRSVLVVVGTLVGAYLLIQVSVTVAPGLGGLIFGIVAAVALVGFMLMREHSRD